MVDCDGFKTRLVPLAPLNSEVNVYKLFRKLITPRRHEDKSIESINSTIAEVAHASNAVDAADSPPLPIAEKGATGMPDAVPTYFPIGHYSSPVPSLEDIKKNHHRI